MESEKSSLKKPFSILIIGLVSLLFSFVPALYLYSVNWKRFGKPKYAKAPFYASIIVGFALLTLVCFEAYYDREFVSDNFFNLIKLIDLVIIYFFNKGQGPYIDAYRKNKNNKYASWILGLLAGIVWMIIVFIGVLISLWLSGIDFSVLSQSL